MCKTEIQLFKHTLLFKISHTHTHTHTRTCTHEHTHTHTHLWKNKILLLIVCTGCKCSASCAQRWQGKLKNSIKNYQNFVYQFHDKGNALLETLAVAHRPQGFTEHSVNAVKKLKASQFDDTLQFLSKGNVHSITCNKGTRGWRSSSIHS